MSVILLLLGIAFSAASAAQSHGEPVVIRGQVRKGEAGQAGVAVTLHRVGRDAAGAVGTGITNAAGEFTLRVPAPDTTGFSIYFTTVDYQGIRYFGPPLQPSSPSDDYAVQVYDTAAAHPGRDRTRVAHRGMILVRAGAGWEVNEIVQVHNEEEQTLVPGTGRPAFEFAIPYGATDVDLAVGELASQDVQHVGSRVRVMGPLRPGVRELLLRYRLQDGMRLELPVVHPTSSLELLVRQPAPHLEVSGLSPAGAVEEGGESFLRFAAADLAGGETVVVEQVTPLALPSERAVTAVAVALLVLALGTGALLRRRRSPSGREGIDGGETSASVAPAPRSRSRPPPP